ncbi:MAG: thioredoxin family protein, partial [Proteobacteria bacterium]|nr:thioredoxin family protein [Cystobacterineae bacterium]MCL2314891.1 thioredoxin family protein [Pseudomonadota bacterium]
GLGGGLASFSEGLAWWRVGGLLFVGGVLTALTPCVYPLIPITVGVLGATKARSKVQAVGLTAAYIAGMGLVFSAAGLMAALSGQAFGFLLSSRWVLLGLACFMALLSASMLGFFELSLPYAWAQRLGRIGGGGGLWGALLMGGAAGLLAAPCTGPILSGLLAYIAQHQALGLGAVGLFIYAMGIGVPFFLVGVCALKLPKGGRWMGWVKYFFGVVLAVLALNYLKGAWPALDSVVVWVAHSLGRPLGLALAGVLVFLAIIWGGRQSPEKGRAEWAILGMLLVAIFMRFELPPEKGVLQSPFVWDYLFSAQSHSMAGFDEALLQAKEEGRPVLVDFFAQWCVACRELDKISYADAKVQREAERFIRIKVDGTRESKQIEALYERFSIQGLPTVIFISPKGELLSRPRMEGFLGPREVLRLMQQVH